MTTKWYSSKFKRLKKFSSYRDRSVTDDWDADDQSNSRASPTLTTVFIIIIIIIIIVIIIT